MKKINSELYRQMIVTAFSFTLVVIISSLWGIVTAGFDCVISTVFFPELLVVLILLQVYDHLLRNLVEKLWLYRISSFIIGCAIAEGAGILFTWFRPTLKNILVCAAVFLLVSSLNYRFWVSKYKADADEINKKLAAEQGKDMS